MIVRLEKPLRVYYSDRKQPLVSHITNVVTVEDYCKWYNLFYINEDGNVVKLEDMYDDAFGIEYCDHTWNPISVIEFCKKHHLKLGRGALYALTQRRIEDCIDDEVDDILLDKNNTINPLISDVVIDDFGIYTASNLTTDTFINYSQDIGNGDTVYIDYITQIHVNSFAQYLTSDVSMRMENYTSFIVPINVYTTTIVGDPDIVTKIPNEDIVLDRVIYLIIDDVRFGKSLIDNIQTTINNIIKTDIMTTNNVIACNVGFNLGTDVQKTFGNKSRVIHAHIVVELS